MRKIKEVLRLRNELKLEQRQIALAGAPQPAARSPWGTSCGNHLNILLASGGERAGKSRVFNRPTMCSGRVRDSTRRLSRSEGQRRK